MGKYKGEFNTENTFLYTAIQLWNEGQKVLASFKKLGDIKLIDKEIYKNEIEVLNDILDNYVPKNIFNQDEIYTYK